MSKINVPQLVYSAPLAADLAHGMSDSERLEMLRQLDAGQLPFVAFTARTFKHGLNRNHLTFHRGDLPDFATSFTGQPFLRDHDTRRIESRDGTITQSQLRDGSFIQHIKLTTAKGMRAYLEGQIDRFSIGWFWDAITCSICQSDWLRCSHWPGRTYEAAHGGEVICELVFENPQGKETSAVNAPAVDGTGILAQLCDCKAHAQEITVMTRQREGADPVGEILLPNGQRHIVSTPDVVAADAHPDSSASLATLREEEDDDGAAANGHPTADRIPSTIDSFTANQEAAFWLGILRDNAIDAALSQSGLSEQGQDAVRLALDGDRAPTPQRVEQLIEAQRTVEARAAEAETIHGVYPTGMLLGGRLGGMLTSLDKVQAATEAMLAGTRPGDGIRPLTSVRELYTLLTGDYEMTGLFQPENIGLSNVNSATMAGLVANAMNKIVINQFQTYPRFWDPIVTIEDFTSLNQVRWITLGGIGELDTVGEGQAYQETTWDDQTETSDWVKKGNYVGLTLEAIDRDDTRKLQQAPRALAQAAWMTLGKAIANIFTSNSGIGPTMSDGNALFHNNHNNLGNTAFSWSAWDSTKTAMRKQTELHSGERLGGLVVPKYALVPPDLETSALQALASELQPEEGSTTSFDAANPFASGDSHTARLQDARRRVIPVDFWTDTNNWAAVADPMLYPSIGLGFRFGRTPEIFSVQDPNSGLMFTNDVMPIKVRFFFAVGPTDWRGLYKHNVA